MQIESAETLMEVSTRRGGVRHGKPGAREEAVLSGG